MGFHFLHMAQYYTRFIIVRINSNGRMTACCPAIGTLFSHTDFGRNEGEAPKGRRWKKAS